VDLADIVNPMASGGVTACNWTIAAPGILTPTDLSGVIRLIARVRVTLRSGDTAARLITSADDIRRCASDGVPGIILGFQDPAAIEQSPELIELFHTLGVRVIQIAYQRQGSLGSGSGESMDGGLSDFGRQCVASMNDVGILIDLSHVGPRTTLDAIDASARPCAFTHTAVGAITSHPRTKSDEAIRRLAARGGVIGVIGVSAYLRPDGNAGTTVDDIASQVLYLGDLVGLDHVGIGLDIVEGMTEDFWNKRVLPSFADLPGLETPDPFRFETYYPSGLRSMANMHVIAEALAARGLSDAEVAQVMGGNFLRLFDEVWVN
jgi:membrane dipeptidase